MKEIVVISGKGGTGKTSITAAFAALASRNHTTVMADCDVDAADLHLILSPEMKQKDRFISGQEAVINPSLCIGCARCADVCRYGAVEERGGTYLVDVKSCEGCGVCAYVCPQHAVGMTERLCGESFESSTRFGTLVHAELAAHAENSGKLVSLVRRRARAAAEKENAEYIIVDGPPGIGCPVIASMTGASAVVIVTEPTLSGEHDLARVAELAAHFRIPAFVCVNKRTINQEAAEKIEKICAGRGVTVAGMLPYDTAFTSAQIKGLSIVEYTDNESVTAIKKMWETICQKIS